MNQLDLIIDALYKVELLFEAHGQYPYTLKEVNEALAAARELQACNAALAESMIRFAEEIVTLRREISELKK